MLRQELKMEVSLKGMTRDALEIEYKQSLKKFIAQGSKYMGQSWVAEVGSREILCKFLRVLLLGENIK